MKAKGKYFRAQMEAEQLAREEAEQEACCLQKKGNRNTGAKRKGGASSA